jgi:hypothetical protein
MSFEDSQVAFRTPPLLIVPAGRSLASTLAFERCDVLPADAPRTKPDLPKFYGANEAKMPQSVAI